MGTHPIFESDFDCLTDGNGGSHELRKKLILAKKQKQNRPVPNWVRYLLVTPSSTTLRDVTGEEPRSVCKSLADPNVHFHYFLNYFFLAFLSDVTRNRIRTTEK